MKTLASREVALGVECAWPPGVALFAPRRKSLLRRRLRFAVAAALLALGVWQFGNGVWIQAKAWLAQALMVPGFALLAAAGFYLWVHLLVAATRADK